MKELIIKERNPFTLAAAIFMSLLLLSLLLPVNRQLLNEQPITIAVFASVLFTILIYSLYKFFDRSVKLRIDRKGIWTSKSGYISWSDIQYYYYPIPHGEAGSSSLVLKSISMDKEIEIDTSYFNTSTTALDRAISENCQDPKVIRLLD